MKNDFFELTVRNRDGVVFQEKVNSISSKNKIGKFDILINHANFISIIDDVLLVQAQGGQKKEIQVGNGILKVRENRVEVFVGVKK